MVGTCTTVPPASVNGREAVSPASNGVAQAALTWIVLTTVRMVASLKSPG